MDRSEEKVPTAKLEAEPPAVAHEPPALTAARQETVLTTPATPRGLVEWFTRRKSLIAARAKLRDVPRREQERLKCARIAAELADRALEPVDPLRSGPAAGLAVSLYREAAYFAIVGQNEALQAKDLAEAFAAAPAEVLTFAAGGPDGLTQIRRALLDRSFVDTAAEPYEAVEQDARLARPFVYALINHKLGPAREVARLVAQRWIRVLALLIAVAGGLAGTAVAISRALTAPDLAAGKPWRASSQFLPCYPEQHRCGEAHTDIFFHTNEEDQPWLEIDLQKPTPFSTIEVVNRHDCCPDRAFPLAIEVSQDAKQWREVARQSQSFYKWNAKFKTTSARYVRLKALKRTWLHLERVSVRVE